MKPGALGEYLRVIDGTLSSHIEGNFDLKNHFAYVLPWKKNNNKNKAQIKKKTKTKEKRKNWKKKGFCNCVKGDRLIQVEESVSLIVTVER